jgi:phosphatidylglycerol---prolipoprotein diacylglyceryl transferase
MLPILYQNHDLILYSYPLLMGLGWGIGYQVFFSQIDPSYPKIKAQILFWGIFVFAWLGAKLLFIFTYPQDSAVNFLSHISFWTGGGFVFYGGFIGALVFVIIFNKFTKKFNANLLWALLPALAFGHGIGRIGCLLAGCCFGKPTNLFWGIYLHDHYRHPTQLLEAIGLLALGFYMLKSKISRVLLVGHYLVIYGCLRFVIEILRGDSIRGEWGSLTPSQWISIGLISSGLVLILAINFNGLKLFKRE